MIETAEEYFKLKKEIFIRYINEFIKLKEDTFLEIDLDKQTYNMEVYEWYNHIKLHNVIAIHWYKDEFDFTQNYLIKEPILDVEDEVLGKFDSKFFIDVMRTVLYGIKHVKL